MSNIKIDTIAKTITFETNITHSEITKLINDLRNYNIKIVGDVELPPDTSPINDSIFNEKKSVFEEWSKIWEEHNEKNGIIKPPFKVTCEDKPVCSINYEVGQNLRSKIHGN